MSDDNRNLSSVPDVEEVFEQPLSATDQAELDALVAEPPSYHTILEVWNEILKSAEAEADSLQPIGPGWASKITTMYPQITFRQMTEFKKRYFGKILEFKRILENEIASDPDCLTHLDAESDSTENAAHYKNMLLLWQQQIVQWEINWDCEDEYAAVELGAISEVHKMFFNEKGITAYLDNIGFQFTEDDQLVLQQALAEMRVEQ